MPTATLHFYAVNNAYQGQGKPYLAMLTGLDRKFGFIREFLPKSANVHEPGIIEVADYDKKDRKNATFYLVFPWEGGLETMRIMSETATEILKANRPITDLAPYKNAEDKWSIRDPNSQAIMWKPSQTHEDDTTGSAELAALLAGYIRAQDVTMDRKTFLTAIRDRINEALETSVYFDQKALTENSPQSKGTAETSTA